MKVLTLTLKFKVPSKEIAQGFGKLLVARMHKYLSKHAVSVHVVDTKID